MTSSPFENRHQTGAQRIYGMMARFSFYALIALLPLAYFPWTSEPLEFNKQSILLVLTSITVIAWLGTMVASRSVAVKKTGFFIVLAVYLIIIALSSAFSASPYVSWVGGSGQEYTSFLTQVCFALLALTGAAFLTETRVQRIVFGLSLAASSLISLVVLLSSVGAVLVQTSFIGTPNALSLYLGAMAVLGCALLLVSGSHEREPVLPDGVAGIVMRIGVWVTSFGAIVSLMAVDYWVIWLCFLIGLASVFAFSIVRREEFPKPSAFFLPMVMMVIAVLFMLMPSFLSGLFPSEVSPSYGASFNIAGKTLADSSFLFGSGPGTFVSDYAKFRDPDLSTTAFWDTRFDRSASHIVTLLATTGVLGAVAFVILMVYLAGMALKVLFHERDRAEWKMTFVAFSGWLVLAVGMILYSSNMTLSFLFWLLSAVIIAQSLAPTREVSFAKSPQAALATTFLFVMMTVVMLTILFVSVSRYAAEIAFAKAVSSDQSGAKLDEVLTDLEAAARLNKWDDVYMRNLAHARLLKLGELARDPAVSADDVQQLISLSIGAGRRATELAPSQVVNWSLLGDIYREVMPVVSGADEFAITSYEKAIELAPSNPKYYVALGRAYIGRSDLQLSLMESEDVTVAAKAKADHDSALASAIVNVQKAIELRESYAPARYYLAAAYERQGNLTDAIAAMEAARMIAPNDVGLALQLGMLYLRQGKADLAQIELERAVKLAPEYANAHWFLSAVYEQQGNFEKAIEQVKEVQKFNPDNEAVKQRLQRLEEGQKAAEIPAPLPEGENENMVSTDAP